MDIYKILAKKKRISLDEAAALLLDIYLYAHKWNIGDDIGEVYQKKRSYITFELLLTNIANGNIVGKLVDRQPEPPYYDDSCDENPYDDFMYTDFKRSDVDLEALIAFVTKDIGDNSLLPQEVLSLIGIKDNKKFVSASGNNDPNLNKELAELRLQKEKWGASIEAATKTGLLFYEHGLEKPASKETFIKEFSQHLGDGLPESTIEKIYKALPSGYRQSGGRPKKDAALANIDNIILAAAFAGSLHEAPERLKLSNLKGELKEEGIDPPDDAMLKKIIDVVKHLDI